MDMRKELASVNTKIRRLVELRKLSKQEIYEKFLSQTAHERIGQLAPSPSVSTTLEWIPPGGWSRSSYIGYCEPNEGNRLLVEQERIESELEALNGERDAILEPYRRRLARKRYAKEMAEYGRRVEDYERRFPAWNQRKREWIETQEKEVLPVGGADPSDVASSSDLGQLFPLWGVNSGRDSSWRFFCTGAKTRAGRLHVFVERPKPFDEAEPLLPRKPDEPAR